jgi:peptide chain release factor 2
MNKEDLQNKINSLEEELLSPNFWNDKDLAQKKIKLLQDLKNELEGGSKYDNGNAIVTIFSGVGGDDAEDFVRMLLEMYMNFCKNKNWQISFLDENQNSNGGYKSITVEIVGKKAYGELKFESGVHRLVRKSPFNSQGKRQTSFAMVEVLPVIDQNNDLITKIKDEDLEVQFSKSSGPGGQNVNKRDTAVRITHIKTGISAYVSSERSQLQNREKAMEIILAKLYNLLEEQKKKEINDLSVSKDLSAKWGNQIRSYVLHPYKMVKDHRTGYETSDVSDVLGGNISEFISSMKNLANNN